MKTRVVKQASRNWRRSSQELLPLAVDLGDKEK